MHFWPKAKCGSKLFWTAAFGIFRPENGIPAQTGMIRTGFGSQNWPKPAKTKIWIKKTWFYTIFDANAWGMYPYFLKFPCKSNPRQANWLAVDPCWPLPATASFGWPWLAKVGHGWHWLALASYGWPWQAVGRRFILGILSTFFSMNSFHFCSLGE